MRLSTDHASARILYIDAYDSFSNNIVGLLEQKLDAYVHVVRIDDERLSRDLKGTINNFDALVLGPGPGSPTNPSDVGVMHEIWKLEDDHILPILGICLGFQSLGCAFGAGVRKLKRARHGVVTNIVHGGADIFEGIEKIQATQYHSLRIDLHCGSLLTKKAGESLWQPREQCPDLQPLAWDLEDEINGPILMAYRHIKKPFWGIQFHPESICTSLEGGRLVETWWSQARAWLACNRAIMRQDRPMLPNKPRQGLRRPSSTDRHSSRRSMRTRIDAPDLKPQRQSRTLYWKQHSPFNGSSVDLVEALTLPRDEVVLLDSQGHSSGRFSIIGLLDPNRTTKLIYSIHNRQLSEYPPGGKVERRRVDSIDEVWDILRADLQRPSRRNGVTELPHSSPFWGGWMGYVSYEAGLAGLNIDLPPASLAHDRPDFNFAFIERSIVIDHRDGLVYVQTLIPDDTRWCESIIKVLNDPSSATRNRAFDPRVIPMSSSRTTDLNECLARTTTEKPNEHDYRSDVRRCQRHLADGESYELCYTSETKLTIPKSVQSWALYKRLRRHNAAPFGAYLHLSGTTIVGSSPERFLSWDRNGNCQLRPIKGTVSKSNGMTYDKAKAILGSSKERAENLMIIDLIRHDLSGVVGAQNCQVTKLMQVEEYQTVFQLVSVIEGKMPRPTTALAPITETEVNARSRHQPQTSRERAVDGLDVLKASLPPGSMTGAPKKRSCEILAQLEQRPRGIYSGVLGYLDVGGGGDFSVVIRSAFSYEDDMEDYASSCDRSSSEKPEPNRIWRVGAGGAVTVQSDDEAEFDEMETKLNSVLQAFVT